LPVEMVPMCWLLYILVMVARQCNSLTVDTNMFNDVTRNCWGERFFEDTLDFDESPSLYLKLIPGGGHDRQHAVNCTLDIATAVQTGSVSAISFAILHLQLGGKTSGGHVVVTTSGEGAARSNSVNLPAAYDQPGLVVPLTNYFDYGSSLDVLHIHPAQEHHDGQMFKPEHIYSPERTVSGVGGKANIQVQLTNWGSKSSALFVFTAYRVQKDEGKCSEEEFECPRSSSFKTQNLSICMAKSLVCDGIPNCGVSTIPGPDEDCGGVQWLFFFLSIILFLVILFFVVFVIVFIINRFNIFHPHINIPMVRIFRSDDSTENLVGE